MRSASRLRSLSKNSGFLMQKPLFLLFSTQISQISKQNESCSSSILPAFSGSSQQILASPSLSPGSDLSYAYTASRVSLLRRQRPVLWSPCAWRRFPCLSPFCASPPPSPDILARCAFAKSPAPFRLLRIGACRDSPCIRTASFYTFSCRSCLWSYASERRPAYR